MHNINQMLVRVFDTLDFKKRDRKQTNIHT